MQTTMMRKRRILLFLGLLGFSLAGLAFYALLGDLPDPHEIQDHLVVPSVRITDRNGRPLYDILDANYGRHTNLSLSQIPLPIQQATIATEDKNFYTNPGVDIGGIIRAFWINLRGREVIAGGSTITQQVARNLLLDVEERNQRTVRRKLRESWLAWRVARAFDKDEILTLYLNQMYYGAMAYGIEAAAQTYFGKTADHLTLAESSLLVGLTQAPALYNPFTDPEAAKARQLVVLDLMHREGYITDEAYELARREPLNYAATPYPVTAPHFVTMVQSELDALFDQPTIYQSGGLTVRTTLNLDWQQHAENIVTEQLARLQHPVDGSLSHNARNAALVALNPHTGEIMALIGSPDYFDSEIGGAINMALMPRQPGSALKPVIYAAALAPDQPNWWTAAAMIPDVRTVFTTQKGESYVPVNFSRDERGPVLLRQALASSLNIPAVLVLDAIGMNRALDFAADLGLDTLGDPEDYDLSFALGGGPVSLLALSTAYATFANGGSRIQPNLILEVTNAAGEVVHTAVPPDPIRVMDERVAWLISDILSDNEARTPSFGANSVLQLDRIAAVKTGTTNDFHDNWTVGYTPDLVVGVWVGNVDNQPMHDVTGVSGAAPIWHYFLRTVLAGQPDAAFPQPSGMVRSEVCALSGLLPTDACPYRRKEWFIAGTQPVEQDSFYRQVTIDGRSGLLANNTTPIDQQLPHLVLDLPPIFYPWARSEGLELLIDLEQASSLALAEDDAANRIPLRLIAPDPHTLFRLSPTLPTTAQKVRLEAVSPIALQDVTLWVDDEVVATLVAPPYEAWWQLKPGDHAAWVNGRDAQGNLLTSEPVFFTVHDVDEE